MRVCVFTGNFGETTPVDLPAMFDKIPGWDYILFTNLKKEKFPETSWDIDSVDMPADLPTRKSYIYANRFYKWHPQTLLPDYDVIIYVDGFQVPDAKHIDTWNRLVNLVGDPTYPISIIQQLHNERTCIYDELDAIVKCKKDTKENMVNVCNFLRIEQFPQKFGLLWNGCYVLDNHCKKLKTVFETLWNNMLSLTYRDQSLYMHAIWKEGANSCIGQIKLEPIIISFHTSSHHVYI